MNELKKWRSLQSQLVFNHDWYKVRRDTVELPNGTIIDDYFLSVRPDIALVFPITQAGEVVFVRQYRHGAGEILLELPAGTFNAAAESPEAAVIRELREETGYVANRLTKLGILYDNPVKETNKIYLFLAQELSDRGTQQLDVTEEIEVVLIPIVDVMDWVMRGEICVSGTVAATFVALRYLQSNSLIEL